MPRPQPLWFPWSSSDHSAGPAIRTVLRDAVWQAVVRQQFDRWRTKQSRSTPLVRYKDTSELPPCLSRSLIVLEVAQTDLLSLANWASSQGTHYGPAVQFVAVLARHEFQEAASRESASRLFQEAGFAAMAANPLEFVLRAGNLLDEWSRLISHNSSNPLAELPLPCWSSTW